MSVREKFSRRRLGGGSGRSWRLSVFSRLLPWHRSEIDMFLLHFGHFADVMFFAGANENQCRSAQNRGAPPNEKLHNAQGE